jgi:hypothetical protein
MNGLESLTLAGLLENGEVVENSYRLSAKTANVETGEPK